MNVSQILNKKTIIYLIVIILIIISIATSYWSSQNISDFEGGPSITGHNGLWSSCISAPDQEQCVDYKGDAIDTNLQFIRSLSIIAAILILAGLFLLVKNPSSKYIVILFVAAGIFSVIANILWTQSNTYGTNNTGNSVGYSWYLNLFAGIIALVSAGLIQYKVIN